jgi:hypothetical protein
MKEPVILSVAKDLLSVAIHMPIQADPSRCSG